MVLDSIFALMQVFPSQTFWPLDSLFLSAWPYGPRFADDSGSKSCERSNQGSAAFGPEFCAFDDVTSKSRYKITPLLVKLLDELERCSPHQIADNHSVYMCLLSLKVYTESFFLAGAASDHCSFCRWEAVQSRDGDLFSVDFFPFHCFSDGMFFFVVYYTTSIKVLICLC